MFFLFGHSAFTPSQVAGLLAWWDAKDIGSITKDGSNVVSAWADKSGNGWTVTAPTGEEPAYNATAGPNSNPGIVFDGNNDVLSSAANFWTVDNSATLTVIVVSRRTGVGGGSAGRLISTGGSTSTAGIISSSVGGGAESYAFINTATLANQINVVNAPTRNEMYVATLNAGVVQTWDRGAPVATAGSNAHTSTNQQINIGGLPTAAADRSYSGAICEVIVYSRVITATERQQIERYLSVKWGIALLTETQKTIRALGPAVWLDAAFTDTLTFNSTTISNWANLGTKGVANAIQATANLQPVYNATGINSMPAIQSGSNGSGSMRRLEIADHTALGSANLTGYVVIQRVTDSGAEEVVWGQWFNTGNQRRVRQNISSTDLAQAFFSVDGTSAGASPFASGTISTGTPAILRAMADGTNASQRVNSGTLATAALASVFDSTSAFWVGSAPQFTTSNGFEGLIAELLYFDSALSEGDDDTIMDYLSAKWGITLS